MPAGLRERKKLQTREQLQHAALRLFAERGFDNVTTDDIAAAVDVSKTTFYRYFDSKEDVLVGNASEGLDAIRAALADRPADEPILTTLRHAVAAVVTGSDVPVETKLARGRIMRSSPALVARNLEHQAACESVIAEFVGSRLPAGSSRDLHARVVAATVIAATRAAMEHWLATDGRDDFAVLLDESLATLDRGAAGLQA
jgi:AcrR family transcriptional regulator